MSISRPINCLYIHNRRIFGPKESSWFTFHHISKELERRGHEVAKFSVDFDMTTDEGRRITDADWNSADCIFTVFRDAEGPLKIARARDIPSFLEINYACGEIVQPFMGQEAERIGLNSKEELIYDFAGAGRETYELATYLVGAGNESYTEQTYKDFGVERVKMFRAAIDYDHFVPEFKERGKKIRLTFTAASLNFRKGITYITEAWKKLPPTYHQKIELHMFGQAPFASGTQRYFEELLRFPNVFHYGMISNQTEKYVHEHAISDVMLCPALAEGQSGTALEGLSFGLFPVVSPFTGLNLDGFEAKILSHDMSLWVNEIAETIKESVDNYIKIHEKGKRNRDLTIKKYHWRDFSGPFVDFIEKSVLEYKNRKLK